MTSLRIMVITRHTDTPAFEQRFARFQPLLRDRGVDLTTVILPPGGGAQRRTIRRAQGFDGLWWHRHLLSWWPRRALAGLTVPVVYDFDDAMPFSSRRGGDVSPVRRRRFIGMLHACDVAMVASHYLRELARPHCDRVIVRPNAIELPDLPERSQQPDAAGGPIELLWLGTRENQPYVASIGQALSRLGEARPDVRFRLVAHEPMQFGRLPVDLRRWSPAVQDEALRQCHVGLSPLPDNPWTRGKCSYKVIQYMAYGLPWVGSAVGENIRAAGDARSSDGLPPRGLCVKDTAGWYDALVRLIDDADLRRQMGDAGRAFVDQYHNQAVIADELAELWRQLASAGRSG